MRSHILCVKKVEIARGNDEVLIHEATEEDEDEDEDEEEVALVGQIADSWSMAPTSRAWASSAASRK